MAHAHLVAELLPQTPLRRCRIGHPVARIGQPHQPATQGLDQRLRPVQRQPQFAQQHVERRFTVQPQQQVAIDLGDHTLPVNGLRTLRDPRDQRHVGPESHAAEPAVEDATGHTLPAQVAAAAQRELHALGPAAAQAAEHLTRIGAIRHLVDQFAEVGRGRVGVHQRGVGDKAARAAR